MAQPGWRWSTDDLGPLVHGFVARSTLATVFVDQALRVVYMNQALAGLGAEPADLCLGRRLDETSLRIGAGLAPFLQHVLDTGAMLGDVALDDGDRHWSAACHALRGPDGDVVGACAILMDDTARHATERGLYESEERYRALVELIPDGIAIIENEEITYVNAAGVAILGAQDAHELIGRPVGDFALPDVEDPGGLVALARSSSATGRDTRIRRLDGSEAIVSLRAVAVDRGVASMQVIFRDVTGLRADEVTRRRETASREMDHALLEAILRDLPVGVVVSDGHGKLVIANDAAERIWGQRFGPWPLPLAPWVEPDAQGDEPADDGPLRLMFELGQELAETDVAREVVCGDGVTRWLRGNLTRITTVGGTPVGSLATFWDATALARAQEELRRTQEALETRVNERTASLAVANERLREEALEREAVERRLRMGERLAAIGTLAAGVAHEINNPLAAIVATAELARAMNGDEDRRGEVDAALARIVEEAHRGGVVVKSLLHLGARDRVERWPVDVNALMRRLAESSRVRSVLRACRLRTRLARRPLYVEMDPTELEQVVLNLVQNAVQAGAGEIAVRTAAHNGSARIVVRDDGGGIDPQHLERIFDPFFTTRGGSGGTGLGLSVVHGIVTRHEGRVHVQSRVGRGTSFTVELPGGVRGAPAA